MSNVFQKWLFRRTIGAQVIQDRPADGFAEGGSYVKPWTEPFDNCLSRSM